MSDTLKSHYAMKEIKMMQETFVSNHIIIQADVGVSLLAEGVDVITNETTIWTGDIYLLGGYFFI